jgi:hypothetical protein
VKKLKFLGILAVAITIAVASIIIFSNGNQQTLPELYVVQREEPDGEIRCPNGNKIIPSDFVFSLKFSDDSESKGVFSATSLTPNSPEIRASFSEVTYDSGNYFFKGEGIYNSELEVLCLMEGNTPVQIEVWGICGNEVIISFETSNGIAGKATGNANCI